LTIEPTRRGFLQGLLGVPVVAAIPALASLPAGADAPKALDWQAIKAPPGLTYQWVRTALLGVPDPENVQKRLDNGWIFVGPDTHAGAPVSTLGTAVEHGGLVLMAKATSEVEKSLAVALAEQEERWARKGFRFNQKIIKETDRS